MSDVKGRAREALSKITPGPWEVADEIDGVRAGRPTVVKATHSDNGYFAGRKSRVVTVGQTRGHFGDGRTDKGQDEANVAFIAAAPQLVADLLSLVEEQEKQIEAARKLAERGATMRPWTDSDGPSCDAVSGFNELGEDILRALGQLDGTPDTAVALMTGMTREELDELGGFE